MSKFTENFHSEITQGEFAIVQKFGGEHLRLCRLYSNQRVLIEKLSFDPQTAIGKPFGIFEVSNGGKMLTQIATSAGFVHSSDDLSTPKTTQDEGAESMENSGKCSIAIGNETQSRQKLTAEEITALKKDGIGANGLVNKLVEGNSSFQERTPFSKQKYIRKKAQKHSDRILIMRPSIRLLCKTYFFKDPERLAHLRLDQLGLMLQLAAIHSGHSNVFVYEQTLGLLGAAVLERLAGQGNCIFLHNGDWPQSIPCIQAMNFDEKHQKAFLPLRITTFMNPELLEEERKLEELQEEQRIIEGEEEAIPSKKPKFDANALEESRQKRTIRMAKERSALGLITPKGDKTGQLDSICLAARTFDVLEILQKIFPALRQSGSLVIYSPIKQNLLQVSQWLRSTNAAVDIQLNQQFFRSQQVLQNRTHPLMQQIVTGGFVLHAVKVQPLQSHCQRVESAAGTETSEFS